MNQLTAQQRKLVYAAAAVLLFVPILYLGAPSQKAPAAERAEGPATWGQLSQMRTNYELGESSLGDVDPTSATMNLVLLGLRGVAASLLWQQADHERETKNFAQLERTVESIIKLQPHFKSVWEYQAWNLAFNVSAECDAVEDRFFWVKRGAKFLIRGTKRNERIPELAFESGRFFGQKIGRSDEKETFRKFFKQDPDTERWAGGPDEDVNPEGKDNYEVARDWYFKANSIVELPGVTQHKMDLALFLAYPYRSLMDYGTALESEGVQVGDAAIDPSARELAKQQWAGKLAATWEKAYQEWTTEYGLREIETAAGMGGVVVLETDEPILRTLAAREGMTYENKLRWHDQYRKLTNYPYWKQRCDISVRPETIQARFDMAEGKRLFNQAEDEAALEHLERGMAALQSVIDRYDLPDGSNPLLLNETELVEDALKSIMIWERILQQLGKPKPESFPLQRVWNMPELEGLREELFLKFVQIYG